ARLESDLAELLDEKEMNMARPMRGVVRDALMRQYERAEDRIRARIAALLDGRVEEPLADE
ncbi:MAG: hypothetical protein M1582_05490, partial [Actinobacteria bacterium]|nr:hypothetical protein [Actinomycetota bacterium]